MSPPRASTEPLRADICVLGAGPAGSLVAQRLAGLGHDVTLVERCTDNLPGRGESLPLSIAPFLRSIEIDAIVESATYQAQDEALVLWHPAGIETTGKRSLLVDRSRLDVLMRRAAARAGARILAPARARSPYRLAGGGWHVPLAMGCGSFGLTTRFLVDARGRRRGAAIAPVTVALCGRWRKVDPDCVQTRIEAGDDAWLWGNRQPDGSYAVTVFLEPDRVAGLAYREQAALFRGLVGRSRLFRKLSANEVVGALTTRDATLRAVADPIGPDFIRVGEASVALDPLSSQGIQAALRAAVEAGAAVHTLLTDTAAASTAFEFYRDRQRRVADDARLCAAKFYAASAHRMHPFWERRAGRANQMSERHPSLLPALPAAHRLRLSCEARLADVPVLLGNRIARAPALLHPSLPAPVAFFGEISLPPLIRTLATPSTADEIARRWAADVPAPTSTAILQWMWGHGILVV